MVGTRSLIKTARLQLDLATLEDDGFIFQLLNDASFIDNIADKGIKTLDDAKGYIQQSLLDSYQQHGFGMYIVRLLSDGCPIGLCGLLKRDSLDWPDVGYALLPQFTGQGYAVEAAQAALDFGYQQLGLAKIVAFTTQDNQASIKVLERIGLKSDKITIQYDEACLLFE